MKKFLALLISVVMVMGLVAIPAAAEGEVTFTATTVNEVNPGEDVSIVVTATGDTAYQAHGLNLGLYYDPANLELVSCTPGSVLTGLPFGTTALLDSTTLDNKIALGIMCPQTPFSGFGEIFTVVFHVKDTCTTNQTLDLDVEQFFYAPLDGASEDIPFIVVDGAINLLNGVDPTEVPTPDPTEVPTPAPTDPPATGDLNEALNVSGGSINFVNDTTYPWTIVSEGGRVYAKSGNAGNHSTTSTITATVTANAGDIVQFDYKAWGEGSDSYDWDKCQFSIDGNVVMDYGNHDNDWEVFAYELTAGTHTLTWRYKKDSSVNPDGDYFAVDNVYVGQPVSVESITCTESLSVPMNRTAQIEWTVLPEAAFDKSVTFTSNDPSIATVNANGVVTGVAVGETFVTITSVADPSVYAVCEVEVYDAGFVSVELYGYAAYDPSGAYDGVFVHFYDYDPANIIGTFASAPMTFAAAFAGGNVYGFLYNNGDQRYYIMDASTGSISYPGTSASDGVFAMAYDHANGVMYAITGTDSRYISTVNLATGIVTSGPVISGMANSPMTLAIDVNGNAYTIEYQSGDLYRLNTSTGAATRVGATGISVAYVQSMTYDHANNQILWAQYNDSTDGQLVAVDPNTASATVLGPIGGGIEMCGLYIKNNLPVSPIEMPDVTVTFVDGIDGTTIDTMVVEAGTVLNEADFPTPPTHEGLEFVGWNYDGSAVYTDITITARYRDPNATTATVVLNVPSDVWGDGSGYQMLLDADATAYGTIIPESGGLTSSGNAPAGVYDEFEYKIPENADGNMNTSNIIITGSIAIEIPAGVYDWCITNPTPGDRIWIASSNGNIPGRYDNFEFEAGNTYTFTVTFGGTNDQVDLTVDGGTPTPTTPPSPTTPPEPGTGIIWDFETDPIAQGWTFLDNDGDGYNWEWNYGADPTQFNFHEGVGYMMSNSYVNNVGALTPDNWAVTPNFTVPGNGVFSFWAQGQDPSWASEVLGVFIKTVGKKGAWEQVGSNITLNGNDTQYNFDISAYAGQEVQVAIRHYNVTDMFIANVDYVTVTGDDEPNPTNPPAPTNPPIEPGTAVFTVESVDNVEPGSQITVDYTLEGEFDANIMNTVLTYDDTVLELVNVVPGPVLGGTGNLVSLDYNTDGVVLVGMICATETINTGVILSLTFNVADDFDAPTTIVIGVEEFGFLPMDDDQAEDVDYVTVDGVISPAEPVVPTEPPVEPTEPPVEPGTATFTMESKDNVAPGSQITLDFTVTGEYEAHVLGVYLNYDASVLEFVSATAGEVLTSVEGATVIDGETVPGSIRLGLVCLDAPLTANGTIVSVTFNVASTFAAPTVIVVDVTEFGYMPVGNTDAEPIDFVAINGTVTPATQPGPNPPPTGFISLAGIGVIAIMTGAGIVIFRKKED